MYYTQTQKYIIQDYILHQHKLFSTSNHFVVTVVAPVHSTLCTLPLQR
uniref:Uncharacterized protein n=1 Tax=Anguilla anguilla TaxID=7936 RepID=A0A0E9SXC0_ANGAN